MENLFFFGEKNVLVVFFWYEKFKPDYVIEKK